MDPLSEARDPEVVEPDPNLADAPAPTITPVAPLSEARDPEVVEPDPNLADAPAQTITPVDPLSETRDPEVVEPDPNLADAPAQTITPMDPLSETRDPEVVEPDPNLADAPAQTIPPVAPLSEARDPEVVEPDPNLADAPAPTIPPVAPLSEARDPEVVEPDPNLADAPAQTIPPVDPLSEARDPEVVEPDPNLADAPAPTIPPVAPLSEARDPEVVEPDPNLADAPAQTITPVDPLSEARDPEVVEPDPNLADAPAQTITPVDPLSETRDPEVVEPDPNLADAPAQTITPMDPLSETRDPEVVEPDPNLADAPAQTITPVDPLSEARDPEVVEPDPNLADAPAQTITPVDPLSETRDPEVVEPDPNLADAPVQTITPVDPLSEARDPEVVEPDPNLADAPAPEYPITFEEIEAFVQTVQASAEHHVHDSHSGKMDEHMAAMALTSKADATHFAIRSGDWNDPNNWYEGRIPGDDARALIPESIHMTYGHINDERLFTLRVDGQLDFATDVNSQLVVDTIVVSPVGTLTIGTQTKPVQDNVNVDIIFANNGAIDTNWDPMLLSRGMIAHGKVEINGVEKDSHEKVIDDPMAGDTSIKFASAPTGWAVGDKIVIAGTVYEGYIAWDPSVGYYASEDEERIITAIEGGTVFFEEALVHDHASPRADLKTSVANYTRNVSFETEDALNAEVHERGHVMFMHNDNVHVRYAEFSELGRTDKSEDARNASELSSIESDSNVKGRYAFHLHRAGTDNQDDPAIVEGNAVYGSPGWGFVQHDSNAILASNASFNTFGAGYVAESGNETGVWHDNIAILAQGQGWQEPKGINDTENFDLGRSGDGFWFQGRMVESTDNIAASVHNGFVYFHRGPIADDGNIRIDSEVSPIAGAFNYSEDILPDRHPILGFSGNEAFAAKTGLYVLKAGWLQQHDVHTVMEDFTAWSVRDGAFLSYTGHYLLKDFDLIAREDSDLRGAFDTGIKLGNNIVDITIVDARIEGFQNGIDLNKVLVNETLSPELHGYSVINPTFVDVDSDFKNFDPELDLLANYSDLPNLAPDIALEGPLVYNHDHPSETPGGRVVQITGTKNDTLGTTDFPNGPENYSLSATEVRDILLEQGYFTDVDGQKYFVLEVYFSDRITGEIYVEKHPVFIEENAHIDHPNHLFFKNPTYNGMLDLNGPDAPVFDTAQLWATPKDGQLVFSSQPKNILDLSEQDAMLVPQDDPDTSTSDVADMWDMIAGGQMPAHQLQPLDDILPIAEKDALLALSNRPDTSTSDGADLWAVLTAGQPVLSEEREYMLDDEDLHIHTDSIL